MRVVIADDNLLVRRGIASLLEESGLEVAAQAGDAEELLRAVDAGLPDVVIVDIRMPPTYTDEGLVAAQAIRARHPDMAIVILSQHVEFGMATRVLAESPSRLAYLLKERVTDVGEFVATLRRVSAGGTALDPEVVSRLLSSDREEGPLTSLTPREREVLALMAEGLTNIAIAERLVVTERAVEKHVTNIFGKLHFASEPDHHRRVMAVLTYVQAAA
jgi:DNA-binding NarL/FixJ family response regulator